MRRFDDTMPIYLQLREEIERAIISGGVEEGEMIPSIRSLSQQYKLNPQTVSNALSELVSEEVIVKKRGIGFFVNDGVRERLLERKSDAFRQGEMSQCIRKGARLGIDKSEFIDTVNRIYNDTRSTS
ncbi:MAG: GntR family transcriptional regulator [Candidatus Cloacimonetes bacterium]|nr:GntR family transcriptional regulator [Candidatus Cloacimonadota bacterium]